MKKLRTLHMLAGLLLAGISVLSGQEPRRQAAPPCRLIGNVRAAGADDFTVSRHSILEQVRLSSGTVLLSEGRRLPRTGDSVWVECIRQDAHTVTATSVAVNVARYSGTITSVRQGEFFLTGKGGAGEAPGRVRVLLQGAVHYVQGTRADIRRGRDLEVTGYDLGHKTVDATALNIWPKE